jgi:uronate dehydrogenase
MGGVSTEQPWEPILAGNIVGMVNLYEAARQHGTKRIVFASSNHVTGFYRQDEVITPKAAPRPDGFYGLSKAFGEDVAQLYWDRWGIETVSLRIGSSFTEPRDRRMLATWLSYDDLERLIVAALTAPIVGHSIIYGVSDNQTSWWDNTPAKHIGYRPQDRSDGFRPAVEARQPVIDRQDPAALYQGGAFVKAAPHA